ncbi:gamma-glutamyltransferase [Nocardioides sp.]|uniref:gamma-glutamyltransferase n=1 Tax=Nocardioides sp. TaxID=35761 RepID=UPI003D0ACACC
MSSHQVAVAATGQQSLEAGLGVAADGGNAFDAAMAAALVAMVTEPGVVSIGGGGFISAWPAGGEPIVIDGNVEMPGRGLPPERRGGGVREVVTTYGGGVTMHAGHGSVATPGIVPAFDVAHERFARLDWARLVAPAISAGRDGYPMSSAASLYLGFTADTLFGSDPEAHALVTRPDGGVLAGGERTRNVLVADTLEQLATEGPSLFTHGAVARALVNDMAANGGLITAEDLAAYQAVVRPAYCLDVGAWHIATNPPPSVGGPMLAIMLGELARRDAEHGGWTWADAIEIQRAVLGYRTSVHDLSGDLTADGLALLRAVGADGLKALRTSPSTAHISAVDSLGNACAITVSSGYGAGMTIPGTGILLNNSLGEMELNRRGLHAAPPGTRLASNMAPTTGRTDDGRVLAIGSPGADRITTALMLVLGQGCLRHADLQSAIADPRVHLRLGEDGSFRVEYERDRDIEAAVAASGLSGHEYPEPHMYFGGVGAAYHSPDGQLTAAGDSRRAAATGVS